MARPTGFEPVTPALARHPHQVEPDHIFHCLPHHNRSSGYCSFDWDWLNTIEPVSESEYIRHIRLKEPLEVLVDGRIGYAIVLR